MPRIYFERPHLGRARRWRKYYPTFCVGQDYGGTIACYGLVESGSWNKMLMHHTVTNVST